MPKITFWIPQLVTFIAGGLGGSVFIWYMNRATPTTIGYNITTTTVGASPEVKSLVPALKIQIGDRNIPIFYVYAVDFSVQSGPGQDSVEVAVMLPKGAGILGTATQTPTPLHNMSCSPLQDGFACKFGPLNPSPSSKFSFVLPPIRKEL